MNPLDGRVKAIRLSDLPEEAWVIFGHGQAPNAAELEELWQAVAWLWRCVDIRANKVAACKFKVMSGTADVYESDQEDPPPPELAWLTRLSLMLAKVEAAACLAGRAYVAKGTGALTGKIKGLAWLKPSTVIPIFDEETGALLSFERTIPGEATPRELEIEDLVYFWPPDWTVETGPAQHTPGVAALKAAGVLANLDKFLEAYFERGAVKVTLLTYEGLLRKGAAEELKTWWQKVASGVKNAFGAHVVNAGKIVPVVIGEGVKDLENNTLAAEKREDICTAMGVPQSKVTANAANYATKQGDDQSFIADTVIPELRWIQAALNEQLFEPLGLRILFLPEEFPEMQADENERAASFGQYVAAGLPLLLVADMLGIYIPAEYERQLREAEELAMEQRRKLAEISPTGNPADAPGQDDDEDDDEAKALSDWARDASAARILVQAKRLEEAGRFERWLKNDPERDPTDFKSELLSPADKSIILRQARGKAEAESYWRPAQQEPLEPLPDPTADELADPADLARLVAKVERWARREGVDLDKMLSARPISDLEGEE